MNLAERELAIYGGAAGLVLIVLLYASRHPEAFGRQVAGTVGSVAVGAVKGIGDLFGVPDTNMTECQKAIAEGRWWDASFSCPALTFVREGSAAALGRSATTGDYVGDLPIDPNAGAAPSDGTRALTDITPFLVGA